MTHIKSLALLAGLVLALGLTARAADQPKPADHDHHAGAFMDCAKACDDCGRTCNACGSHCAQLVADGKKEHMTTLKTCQDCATVCSAASCITARQGPFSAAICTACADACKQCGDACNKFKDDAMMKQCADECAKCEKACREMLKHTAATH